MSAHRNRNLALQFFFKLQPSLSPTRNNHFDIDGHFTNRLSFVQISLRYPIPSYYINLSVVTDQLFTVALSLRQGRNTKNESRYQKLVPIPSFDSHSSQSKSRHILNVRLGFALRNHHISSSTYNRVSFTRKHFGRVSIVLRMRKRCRESFKTHS